MKTARKNPSGPGRVVVTLAPVDRATFRHCFKIFERENAMPDLAGAKVAYIGLCGLTDSAGVTRLAGVLNTAVNNQYDSASKNCRIIPLAL